MDRVIKERVNYPLSDHDIKHLLNNRTKIIRYPDIHTYRDIEDLLVPFGNCFILYETSEGHGHWTVLNMTPSGTLEFFDPYGGAPDTQLQFVPKAFAKESYQDYHYLLDLIKQSGKQATYNPYQFQKLAPGVKSCGRWCVLRTKLIDLPLGDFKKLFMGKDYDQIVSFLT
jgi:hypothetical protein